MQIIYLATFFLLATSVSLFSADVELVHDVREKHVKSGVVNLIAKPVKVHMGESSKTFEFIVKYQFKTKIFLWPKLTGECVYTLPAELLDPEFYRRMRDDKVFSSDDVSIKYLGDQTIGDFYDAIVLHIKSPKQKFFAKVIYHPDVSGIGFAYMKLKVYGIPFVGVVNAESYLPEIRHELNSITGRQKG